MLKTGDSELDDILVEGFRSTKTFAKVFMPDRFSAEFSSLHDQIIDIIDSGAPRVAIAAPRGIGKTSICIAKAAQAILYSSRKFIPYVGMSHDAALLQTENLKRDLMSSPEITKIFGSLKTKSPDGIEESFSKKSWVSSGGTLVMPRGSGQQIRGVLFGVSRPDLFIVDDLEDPETIGNDVIRTKRKEWFNADLLKATSRLEPGWQIIYIDTLKHEDALLQALIDSHDWESIRLEICDDNYEPTAPEFMSKKEILRERDYHERMGILDVFYREFRNLPISTEDAVFQEQYFKYFELEELEKDYIENVVIVDPAKTVKMHSADSAVVGVGVDRRNARLYVRDIVSGKMHPDELYNEIFLMANRLNCRVVGVEVTGLNEFITQPIKNEMSKRGFFFELIELKARGGAGGSGKGKAERVASLAPFYRQGYIYHNRAVCGGLEAQLLGFPRSKRWDIMDALAYIVEMLELGERYFDPPEGHEDPEVEYDDLDYDEELEGWRDV